MLHFIVGLIIATMNRTLSFIIIFLAILPCLLLTGTTVSAQHRQLMVRIAELEIDSVFLPAYKAILAEEAAASVKLEPGVIAIFPMFDKFQPTQVRILEIYAGRDAYESHLKTAHFIKYKTTTAKMVKSLRLPDMEAIDPATMAEIFRKLPAGK